MDRQLPLFDSPASPVRRTFPAPRSSPVQYTRIARARTRRRSMCDDCCRDIYELGQLLAFPPRIATWRRTDDTTTVMLCQAHKDKRHNNDSP